MGTSLIFPLGSKDELLTQKVYVNIAFVRCLEKFIVVKNKKNIAPFVTYSHKTEYSCI